MSANSSMQGILTDKDSVYFDFSFGEMGRKVHELELLQMIEPDPDDDPEKPPPKERGDKYLFIGTFIGLVVGGLLGAVLSLYVGWVILNIFTGLLVGGFAGLWIGSMVKKRSLSK